MGEVDRGNKPSPQPPNCLHGQGTRNESAKEASAEERERNNCILLIFFLQFIIVILRFMIFAILVQKILGQSSIRQRN